MIEKLKRSDIEAAALVADAALLPLMRIAGISTGDVAAQAFSGFDWAAADTMRGHMDASKYKHVCLDVVFLKYIL